MTEAVQELVAEFSGDTLADMLKKIEPAAKLDYSRSVPGSLRGEVEVRAVLPNGSSIMLNAYDSLDNFRTLHKHIIDVLELSVFCDPTAMLRDPVEEKAWQEIWQEKADAYGTEYNSRVHLYDTPMQYARQYFCIKVHGTDTFSVAISSVINLAREHHDAAEKYNAHVVAEAKRAILEIIE